MNTLSNYLTLLVIGYLFITNSMASDNQIKGLSIITVGPNGSSCDVNSGSSRIQDAVDAGLGDIRIVNSGVYSENIVIDDVNVNLIGGYVDCAAASAGFRNFDDMSVITGVVGANQPVIRITGSSNFNSVNLTGLELSGGGGSLAGGGVSALAADATIVLRNMYIHDNNNRFGGGVGILASNVRTNLLAFDTIITSNQADDGGGFYCTSVGAPIAPMVRFFGESGISDNAATDGQGGGVYLTNECGFEFYSGSSDISSDVGINRNTATQEGGGIYADSGSKVTLYGHQNCSLLGCVGSNEQPVTVASNAAEGNGGGIYLAGGLTTLEMNSAFLTDNTTDANGGGMAVSDGATLTVNRLQEECWDERHCNFFTFNKSGSSAGLGGLVYNDSSIVNINQAELAFNRADFGTVLYGTGSGSITTFIGDVVRDNGGLRIGSFPHNDTYIFRVTAGAQVDVFHSTIADNAADNAVFGIASDAGNTSEIVNSIIHDASTGDVIDTINVFHTSFSHCMVHEDDSVNFISINVELNDPVFINRVNNNYHIHPLNSPAIDYAGASGSFLNDIDFEPRGLDNPDFNDFFGPYDIGADESNNDEIIFKDGFE